MIMKSNMDTDYTKKVQRCLEYVEALEEEQKKIQVFERELPLCLKLVTQAIESCRKELSTSDNVNDQSECSERTTSDPTVFEESIPIKISTVDDEKKMDWLKSVQLWNQSSDLSPKEDQCINKNATVVEFKSKSGAFQPFHKEKPIATSNSTAETGGCQRATEGRKQRRCWSAKLHRRFLHALQQLGGSHVATPKQIKDFMKVDGLTNDEVKSHLQKYRLHNRRPATPASQNLQQPPFMVGEGRIWLPSHNATSSKVYAPVAGRPSQFSPSGERNNQRCKSSAASTHTPQLLPLS